MIEREPFLQIPMVDRTNIVPNMHYLSDRKLVEMMMGYTPPMFSAVRITAAGIDLVENRFTFNQQFPPGAADFEEADSAIPRLIGELIAQGDLSPLDGWVRRQLLNDIQYLRDELSQPRAQWRLGVIRSILNWIAERHEASGQALPALIPLRNAVEAAARDSRA